MKRTDVRRSVERALQELQEISGEPTSDITEETCPADDLGFDSIRTVEASFYISESLGCANQEKTLDLFKSTPETPRITVGTIVERACALVAEDSDTKDLTKTDA